jgi:hypothetical protein
VWLFLHQMDLLRVNADVYNSAIDASLSLHHFSLLKVLTLSAILSLHYYRNISFQFEFLSSTCMKQHIHLTLRTPLKLVPMGVGGSARPGGATARRAELAIWAGAAAWPDREVPLVLGSGRALPPGRYHPPLESVGGSEMSLPDWSNWI